jgi:hypothetical protein
MLGNREPQLREGGMRLSRKDYLCTPIARPCRSDAGAGYGIVFCTKRPLY